MCVCIHDMCCDMHVYYVYVIYVCLSMCVHFTHVCALYDTRCTTIRRLLKMIGLFCKRALEKRRYSAKETYITRRILHIHFARVYPLSNVVLTYFIHSFHTHISPVKHCTHILCTYILHGYSARQILHTDTSYIHFARVYPLSNVARTYFIRTFHTHIALVTCCTHVFHTYIWDGCIKCQMLHTYISYIYITRIYHLSHVAHTYVAHVCVSHMCVPCVICDVPVYLMS